VGLYRSRRTIFLEGTLGHPWKDSGHWINPLIFIFFNETGRRDSIGAKFPAQKAIGEKDLSNNIDLKGQVHQS
jgi:hypothetical protein